MKASTCALIPLIFFIIIAGTIKINTAKSTTELNPIPKPSIPEFNVKLIDRSYDVPLTYTNLTDPFTGQQIIITHGGYHVENRTIDVIIKNQPFTPTDIDDNTTQLFYAIRWKGHFEGWANTYHISSIDYDYYLNTYGVQASNSDSTVKTYTIATFGNVPEGGQVDFQIKAQSGYSFAHYRDHAPIQPIGINFQSVEESDGSNTQSITIEESQIPTSSPEITPTPTPPNNGPTSPPTSPNPLWVETILGALIIIVVLGTAIVFFLHLMKKK